MWITTHDDAWAHWLQTHATGLGFPDVQAIASAGELPIEELLHWGASEQRVRPSVPAVLRVAALLQVDPYDLLIAAGWVNPANADQPTVQIDGQGASFTWERDPPSAVS